MSTSTRTKNVAARFLKNLQRQVIAYNESHCGGVVRVTMSDSCDAQYARIYVEVDVDVTTNPVDNNKSKLNSKETSNTKYDATVTTHRIECTYSMAAPLDAPVVKYLTPNKVFKTGVPVCINGITHYHEESFYGSTMLEQVVDSVAAPLLDEATARDVQFAIGALNAS